MFVCIEGTDASGKNTQTKLLEERLKADRYSFPAYETVAGELIKAHLQVEWSTRVHDHMMWSGGGSKDDDDQYLSAVVFQSLQLTNRMEMACKIRDRLRSGGIVVADRYWPSGWVYGAADGLEKSWLEEIHRLLPQPDIYILVDIDVEDSFKRRPDRRDRYEANKPFLEKVIKLYRELWKKMGDRTTDLRASRKWVVVDGRHPIATVEREIARIVDDCSIRLASGTW